MVLWFLSPLAFALANYVVPLQIGARDLAFPRLNALSYWFYLFGGLLAAIGFFTPGGAIDVGWTVYAPLNTSRFSPHVGVTLGGAGLLMLIASVTMSTINFIVTIFQMRAPGMRLRDLPLYTWGILLTVLVMLVAFPPLAGAVMQLAADRILGTAFFSSIEGGALLWDHLFWFFGHPEVYIVLFPGLFAIGEVIVTFSRRPLYGKRILIVAAIVGSIMSFMVWAHHMFVTGINPDFRKFMTVTTESISIPFGVAVLSYILTLFRSSIRFTTPMLFAIGAIALFILGGVTGVYNASVALDYYLRGSYWIVAHFHYTLVGGTLTGLIAALYYWWPKMSGRMYSERLGRLHFATYMVGFNVLYFPMHYLVDMPRRVYTFPSGLGWEFYNSMATVGAVIFGLSFLIMIWNFLNSARFGHPAGPNPWNTWSLEWLVPSPPPRHNFDGQPRVREDGTIEIASVMTDGGNVTHVEHYSPWPVVLSLSVFVSFVGALLLPPLLFAGLTLFALSIIGWVREDLAGKFRGLVGELGAWPFEKVDKVRLGIWFLIVSETILFGSLLATYGYIRFNSSTWIVPGETIHVLPGVINTIVLLTSSLTIGSALYGVNNGRVRVTRLGILSTLLLGVFFLVNKVNEWALLSGEGFTPSSGLPAATYFLVTGTHAAHVAAGVLALIYFVFRAFREEVSTLRSSLESLAIYWYFVEIVWFFIFPSFYLL